MDDLKFLSKSLKDIVDYELSVGNQIVRIDRPAGTKCPLAVVFKTRLDFNGFRENVGVLDSVSKWENKDRHYDLEAGYVCDKTGQAIAAPR